MQGSPLAAPCWQAGEMFDAVVLEAVVDGGVDCFQDG